MTTTADGGASSPEKSNSAPPQGIVPAFNDDIVEKLKTLEETASPWIDYALKQAQAAQKTIGHHLQDAIEVTKSRLDRIRTTSSAHFNQTLDSLQDAKSDFNAYEDLAIGKIRGPRRILYYKLRRLFASEQVLLSKADAKVKELRQSFEVLKAEAEKLEKAALQAEEEMTRGRTKLRQAGKQIQSVVRSAYKIERQAVGLKDVLRDLPSIEASRFRSQVSNLAKEAKKERRVLNKEVTRISNYGISV
ncbi:RGS1-HXK1-interacting protein 1-like isoform X1 [Coffea arabica]|uniref:RGS1-HXK1-interacting protein 1-like isoform X1 n=1 Tax=Coffea arabica TaxID=13443 RepID=A0ABM4WI26_COFAR